MSPSEYKAILRLVPDYKTLSDEDIILTALPSDSIGEFSTHQTTGVKKFKLQQHKLFKRINNFKTDKIYAITLFNGYRHVINIPILEKIGKTYYIMEGHTRLHAAWELFERGNTVTEVYVAILDCTDLITDTEMEDIPHIPLRELKANLEYIIHPSRGVGHNKKRRKIESYTHGSNSYKWETDFPLETDVLR